LRAAGAAVIALDCRTIEPTVQGFLQALGASTGLVLTDTDGAADQIGQLAPRVVLLLDQFEVFRLIDTWLCQTFVRALPDNIRIATFGRQPPSLQWSMAPEWQSLMVSIKLETLDACDAEALLCDAGVEHCDAKKIAAATHGHPLALRLGARARLERSHTDLIDLDTSSITARLAEMTLADISDRPTRRAIEYAAVVRRVTEPLLAAAFPTEDAPWLYAQLRILPMVEQLRDGLFLHGAVRHAVVASMKSADPDRLRAYRASAWRHLRAQVGRAPAADLWRNTADTIYLLENPVIREAFFPNAPRSLTAAPARPGDAAAILAMVQQHDGPQAASQLMAWWERQPDAFHVIRDAHGQVAGFYCLAASEQVDPYLLVEDPITASWSRHLLANPMPRGQKALFLRRWLSVHDGEAPGPVQAACWLDIKRTYLELRPALRRVYLGLRDMAPYAAVAGTLGFEGLDIPSGKACATQHAMLDFGPASVDGWISGLLGRELGLDDLPGEIGPLDIGARELVVGDMRVPLTPKEFALMRYLNAHADRAVSRDELLEDVWGWKIDGGSNVVDAMVRALRLKLGSQSSILETVRGVGYRYRAPAG